MYGTALENALHDVNAPNEKIADRMRHKVLEDWLNFDKDTSLSRQQEMEELAKPAAPSKRKPIVVP